jgi:FtsH-binding integral membrane protein
MNSTERKCNLLSLDMSYRSLSESLRKSYRPRHSIAYLVASWSTFVLQLVLTAGGAFWVARKVERGVPLHGFLVGLVVALILFIFNPALTNFLQGAYRGRLDLLVVALGTFFLTVAAGWLGGVLGRRWREKS